MTPRRQRHRSSAVDEAYGTAKCSQTRPCPAIAADRQARRQARGARPAGRNQPRPPWLRHVAETRSRFPPPPRAGTRSVSGDEGDVRQRLSVVDQCRAFLDPERTAPRGGRRAVAGRSRRKFTVLVFSRTEAIRSSAKRWPRSLSQRTPRHVVRRWPATLPRFASDGIHTTMLLEHDTALQIYTPSTPGVCGETGGKQFVLAGWQAHPHPD